MRVFEKRNIVVNTVGEGFWGLGWNLAAPLTVLPIIIRRLGGGSFEVGVLAAIMSAGALIPQILGSLFLQTGQGRKKFLIKFHLGVVVPPWIGMGLVMLLLSETRPVLARFSLIALISLSIFSIGFILPVWLDWVAGLFRKEIRGLAFGLSGSASAAGGAVAALIAAYLTSTFVYPWNYSILFFIATGVLLLSLMFFTFVKLTGTSRPPVLSSKDIFGRFRSSLSGSNFRKYLVSRSFVAFGAASVSFFAVYYLSDAGGAVAGEIVIGLGSLMMISRALFSTLVGRLGDRFGHRSGMMAGVIAQTISIAVVILIPGAISCSIAFALTGIAVSGAMVSHQNFLFETCPHDSRTAHITAANLVLAPVTTLAPLAVGKAIEIVGPKPVFLFCLGMTVLGFIWLAGFVRNPDAPSPAEEFTGDEVGGP